MQYLVYTTNINIKQLPNILEYQVDLVTGSNITIALTFLSVPRAAFIYNKVIIDLEENKYRLFEEGKYALTYNKEGFIKLAVAHES